GRSEEIAYNNHELHGGLGGGLFNDDEVAEWPVVREAFAEGDAAWPDLAPTSRRHEALRRVFGVMVSDVIDTSRAALEASGADNVADIRHLGRPVIVFSDALWSDLKQIRAFLFTRMYRAPSVMKIREQVTRVVEDLFPLFLSDPSQLPQRWQADVAAVQDETELARMVSDYIAGMTDRYALQLHAKFVG
ncbi:MAG: deoxyguanosinetriphosphate triphosphohydrolase, partial [Paracoccaceae bacterium]